MVCLPTPEADDSSIHLPLCRYPAEQGLNIRNNDDDDDDEKEDFDDDHHQRMGCHCCALCLQRKVIKSHFFYPIVLFVRIGLKCVRERGRLVTKVKFL